MAAISTMVLLASAGRTRQTRYTRQAMKPKLYLSIRILLLAALGLALWPRSGGKDDAATRVDGYPASVDHAVPYVATVPDPAPFEEPFEVPGTPWFRHPLV